VTSVGGLNVSGVGAVPAQHIYRAIPGGSVAERLASLTQAQKGLGSNRSRDAVG